MTVNYSHEILDTPVSPDISNNQWFNWRLEKNATNLIVFIDGNLIADYQDSTFANANFKFGLSFGEDSQGYFDNVVINTAPIPEPATILLFGTGLAGLIGTRLRKKKK